MGHYSHEGRALVKTILERSEVPLTRADIFHLMVASDPSWDRSRVNFLLNRLCLPSEDFVPLEKFESVVNVCKKGGWSKKKNVSCYRLRAVEPEDFEAWKTDPRYLRHFEAATYNLEWRDPRDGHLIKNPYAHACGLFALYSVERSKKFQKTIRDIFNDKTIDGRYQLEKFWKEYLPAHTPAEGIFGQRLYPEAPWTFYVGEVTFRVMGMGAIPPPEVGLVASRPTPTNVS